VPVHVPAIAKRHAITGPRLPPSRETRPAPGFQQERDGAVPEISRPDFSRKIFNRIFVEKF